MPVCGGVSVEEPTTGIPWNIYIYINISVTGQQEGGMDVVVVFT